MSNPDNTLDDLILSDPAPQKGKSKSLLLLLALVIVLIIVGAILAKMIFSDSSDSVADKKEDVKKSELVTTVDNNKVADIDTNMSADLAPISDDPDLAPIDDSGKNVASNSDTINLDETKKDKNDKKATEDDVTENTTANNLGVAPVSNSKIPKTTEVKIDNSDDVVINTKPKTTHKKPTVHTKPKPKKHVYGGTGNVYIQVGSFTKGPEQSFIRKIRNAGFKYRIKTTNGYRRVYVGPFRSRSEANNVLGIVKSKIAPNAFVK